MHMADIGENMMLYLMVQASGKPIYNAVFSAKIYSREQFV